MTTKNVLIGLAVILIWILAVYLTARWIARSPQYVPAQPQATLPEASSTPLTPFEQQVISEIKQATTSGGVTEAEVSLPPPEKVLNELRQAPSAPVLSEKQKQQILNDLRK